MWLLHKFPLTVAICFYKNLYYSNPKNKLFHQDVPPRNDIFLCPSKMLFHPCYATPTSMRTKHTLLFGETLTIIPFNINFSFCVWFTHVWNTKTEPETWETSLHRTYTKQRRLHHDTGTTSASRDHREITAPTPRDHYAKTLEHCANTTVSPLCHHRATTVRQLCDHHTTMMRPLRLASRSDADKNEGRNEKGEKRRETRGVGNVKEMTWISAPKIQKGKKIRVSIGWVDPTQFKNQFQPVSSFESRFVQFRLVSYRIKHDSWT